MVNAFFPTKAEFKKQKKIDRSLCWLSHLQKDARNGGKTETTWHLMWKTADTYLTEGQAAANDSAYKRYFSSLSTVLLHGCVKTLIPKTPSEKTTLRCIFDALMYSIKVHLDRPAQRNLKVRKHYCIKMPKKCETKQVKIIRYIFWRRIRHTYM